MTERSQTYNNETRGGGLLTLRFSPVEKPSFTAGLTPDTPLQLPGSIQGTVGQLLENPAKAVTTLQAAQVVFERMHGLVKVDTQSRTRISDAMKDERKRVLRDLFSQRDDVAAKTRRDSAAGRATQLIHTAADLYTRIR